MRDQGSFENPYIFYPLSEEQKLIMKLVIEKKRNWWQGYSLGLLVGAALGIALGVSL